MKKIILFLHLVFFTHFLIAQDVIIKSDKTAIKANVIEVGLVEIKYTLYGTMDDKVYVISKNEVSRIAYVNGKEDVFTVNELAILPERNHGFKHCITMKPLSPAFGFVGIGYQCFLHPKRAFVAEFGMISPRIGNNNGKEGTGVCFKTAFRFKFMPIVKRENMQWSNSVSGFYFQPEVTVSSYETTVKITEQQFTGYAMWIFPTYSKTTYTKTVYVNSFALMMSVGHQSNFLKRFTFDVGASIGFGSTDYSRYYSKASMPKRHYSHREFGKSSVMGNLNLSIGYMFR